MKILNARNVHEALPVALVMLKDYGLPRDSRNGPVLQFPQPVATVYEKPTERVLFWPERDANPFFHLYESLWMLAGRNDVAGPARYAKQMKNYSDDGSTLHGAYGYRWRKSIGFHGTIPGHPSLDQLQAIIKQLRENKEDRRAVLQMWDGLKDLGKQGKDLPCNLMATFQVGVDNRLHLVVFCRSNDIIWGCYGANAVHFSMLLEYMALGIGVNVGTYTQVSVNWHAYLDMFQKMESLATYGRRSGVFPASNPYEVQRIETTAFQDNEIKSIMLNEARVKTIPMRGHVMMVDEYIHEILHHADTGFPLLRRYSDPWADMVYNVLRAHHVYKTSGAQAALKELSDETVDWVVAAREWLERRVKCDGNHGTPACSDPECWQR